MSRVHATHLTGKEVSRQAKPMNVTWNRLGTQKGARRWNSNLEPTPAPSPLLQVSPSSSPSSSAGPLTHHRQQRLIRLAFTLRAPFVPCRHLSSLRCNTLVVPLVCSVLPSLLFQHASLSKTCVSLSLWSSLSTSSELLYFPRSHSRYSLLSLLALEPLLTGLAGPLCRKAWAPLY